jgi:hypothetical protein
LKRADHASFPEAAMDSDTCYCQQPGNNIAGARFLEAEFGMGVQIVAKFSQKGQVTRGKTGNRHQ